MTFREKLQQEHPAYVDDKYKGGCVGCPDTYNYEKSTPCGLVTEENCRKCWDRVIPGTELSTLPDRWKNQTMERFMRKE